MSETTQTKWEQNAPKWERDFDRFLSIYRAFLIHGFVNDLQPLPQAYDLKDDREFKTTELFSYFNEVYTENRPDRQQYGLTGAPKDYCVIGYNPTLAEGQRFEFYDDACIQAVRWTGDNEFDGEPPAEQNGSDGDDKKPPNPFKGKDADKAKFWAFVNNEKIEESLPAGHGPGGLSLDFSRIHLALTGGLGNRKPYMFVVLASRMSMAPGNVSNAEENQTFAVLSLLTNALDVKVRNKANPNRLVMIADKSNDIPAWLSNEQYNHTIKKLHIAKPNTDARQYYFDNEFQTVGPMRDIKITDSEQLNRVLDSATAVLTDNEREFISVRRNYVNKTDGFSMREMLHLTRYIETEKAGDGDNKITKDNISLRISAFKSGVSVNPWTKPDTIDKIRRLEAECGKVIIGQARVLKSAAGIMELAVTETNRVFTPSAPRAVLFLAGPTGTGKTELAKQLTELVFGNQDRMKRFDMSEFRSDHTEARLFGSPPGYVGHEAGGELTEYVKRFPFSLILFDEIEKACSSIMDKFLQILSDGRLTDGQGETVDFSNTIIVMTSNAGIKDPRKTGANSEATSDRLMTPVTIDAMREAEQRFIAGMAGLEAQSAKSENAALEEIVENPMPYASTDGKVIDYVNLGFPKQEYEELDKRIEQLLNKNLEKHFADVLGRPELYGRLKESIICYNYITADAARDIAMIYVDKVNAFVLEKHNVSVQMEKGKPSAFDEVKNLVARECINPRVREFGARGVIENVKTLYARSLSSFIIGGSARGKKVRARVSDNKIVWSV